MSKLISFFVLLNFLVFGLFSCTKIQENKSFELEDFPLSVGNTWTYNLYSGSDLDLDTLVMTVVKKVSDKEFLLELVTNETSLDTLIINTKNDTLKFEAVSQQVFLDFMMPLPLKLNNSWTGAHTMDGYEVSAYTRKLELAEQKYKRIFSVKRLKPVGYAQILQNIDFATGIGIIRCRQGSFDGSDLINDSLVLTKYLIQ